ncbi:aminoacyl-tRNA deacylase [Candidatus Leptofilum sp.]|uniref:aminoacyl-tRNA deacylase n=1 Tax=Candidatus Leptofilum sp. TaxID=3241576 RepID=UPI003B59A5F3
MIETPVTLELDQKQIPYTLFTHNGPVRSLEQAAKERNQQPEQVVRSLLFRLAQDDFLMVLVAGPQQIDWKQLRRTLGLSRLTMAKPDDLRRITGYEIGAVAPFGLPKPVRILVDQSVLNQTEISLGSGVRGTAVLMRTADLLKALGDGAEVVSL